MNVSTDERLTESLERLAAHATVPLDGHLRVERRLRTRRNRRRTALGIAAVVGVLFVSAAVIDVSEGARREVTTASPGDGAAPGPADDAPATAAQPGDGHVPRLTLNLSGVPLVSVTVSRDEFTAEQLSEPLSYRYFQSFRPAPDDWSQPSFYIYTTAPEGYLGIGEDSPAESTTTVDVNGNVGYLTVMDGHRSLGWRLPDGTTAYVLAPGMPPEQLVDLARSMTLRPNGQGWDVAEMPHGLVPVMDEENTRNSSLETHSLTFEGEPGLVELHSYTTTRIDMETRIADYSVGAEVTGTSVDGHAAAITRSPHDVRVLWYDDTNNVANYMIIDGVIEANVDQVVAAITELSEQAWNELLATTDVTYGSGDETSSSTSTP